jgi:hypothetical protein
MQDIIRRHRPHIFTVRKIILALVYKLIKLKAFVIFELIELA